eukprot:scaffold24798_cov101-Isochrysis_galbana.AAC.2
MCARRKVLCASSGVPSQAPYTVRNSATASGLKIGMACGGVCRRAMVDSAVKTGTSWHCLKHEQDKGGRGSVARWQWASRIGHHSRRAPPAARGWRAAGGQQRWAARTRRPIRARPSRRPRGRTETLRGSASHRPRCPGHTLERPPAGHRTRNRPAGPEGKSRAESAGPSGQRTPWWRFSSTQEPPSSSAARSRTTGHPP